MHNETSANNKSFLIGMVLSMICWGFSWASAKVLTAYGDPLTISFYRFALTVVSLFFILLIMKEPMKIHRKGLRDLLIASLLMSVYTYLFFKGLTTGKAGAGGVLVTVLNPIIAYVIMLTMAWRKPTRNEFLGLVLGLIAGVILLRLVSNADQIFDGGNIYFLASAFCWAVLSLFTSRATRYGSSVTFSFWLYGISTALMFLVSGTQAASATIRQGDLIFWGNLFFSSTITAALATTFYFVATTKIGASRASSFIFMVPFFAAIGSWIFLNEIPQMHTIIGGILGVAAVYILNKK